MPRRKLVIILTCPLPLILYLLCLLVTYYFVVPHADPQTDTDDTQGTKLQEGLRLEDNNHLGIPINNSETINNNTLNAINVSSLNHTNIPDILYQYSEFHLSVSSANSTYQDNWFGGKCGVFLEQENVYTIIDNEKIQYKIPIHYHIPIIYLCNLTGILHILSHFGINSMYVMYRSLY